MSQEAAPKTKLGYSEYVCYPDDGNRHEIIDGDHYMNPAPNTYHQAVSMRLSFLLFGLIEESGLGRVFSAPTDVQLTDHDIVQPDLLVISKERSKMITPVKIKGIPDLVVEILSPATKDNDLNLKKELYQKSGVKEYWIVDPDDQSLQQLVLNAGRFEELSKSSVQVALSFLADVVVDLKKVW
jgi:Uma2 family endonuclease